MRRFANTKLNTARGGLLAVVTGEVGATGEGGYLGQVIRRPMLAGKQRVTVPPHLWSAVWRRNTVEVQVA
jgi:hypothetical protein